MNIIFFDTETTGIPVWGEPSGIEKQPHIVQLAAHLVDSETREILETMDEIIKPNGWTIPQETINIHGITNERANDVGIPEVTALQIFFDMWSDSSLRVAHNTTFDNRIIRIGTKRYFSEVIQERWKAGEYKCTGLLTKPIMQMLPKRQHGYKMPKLVEAYKYFFGKEFEGAHTAIGDVNACMAVYWAVQDLTVTQ